MGTYVHEDRGGQLAAARGALAIGPGGVGAHIAKQFFRDEEATHMENITKSVNFACGQLRLGKDATADAKALVVKACDGRWGEGEWTTMLTGACVYAASRQNALPITVRDVAEACQLDVFALGRVYNRLKFLHELKVPPLDPATFVARAAAAIPQLRDAMGGGDENDARGADGASRASASAAKAAKSGQAKSGQQGDKPVDRGAKLAPVVEDAKRLLAFAERRGLMTGRGPFPMVAAALGVAAAARGIALPPEALAAGARAAVTSTKKSLVALKRELGTFAASCAWFGSPDGSSLDDPNPFQIRSIASSSSRHRAADVDKVLPLALASLADAIDADDGARLDAMPVAFRVADGVRAARLAKIERCKVTGSLDDEDGYGDEEYGDATGAEAEAAADAAPPEEAAPPEAAPPEAAADAGGAPSTSVVVAGPARRRAPKRLGPNRGGLKPRRRRKHAGGFAGIENDEGSRLAIGDAAVGTNASTPPPAAARLLEGTNGASAGGAPLGWTDVLIQQLLLAGVPERLVVEEDGLFPDVSVDQSTGAVKPVRPVRARSSAVKPPPDAGDEMEAAETAAHRVLERWRAESSRDPLLDAEAAAAAAGGDDGDDDDERATAARILAAREAVEKADADAIAAIPDEDVAGLIRTEEEAAVVKAMAARRLVQFDADDYYKIIGDEDEDEDDDGDEDGLVPVVKGERAEAETEDGAR